MEVKERRGDEETAPRGAETWPCASPPGLSPRWEEEEKEGKDKETGDVDERVTD